MYGQALWRDIIVRLGPVITSREKGAHFALVMSSFKTLLQLTALF